MRAVNLYAVEVKARGAPAKSLQFSKRSWPV